MVAENEGITQILRSYVPARRRFEMMLAALPELYAKAVEQKVHDLSAEEIPGCRSGPATGPTS
jgi:hypothetical protein